MTMDSRYWRAALATALLAAGLPAAAHDGHQHHRASPAAAAAAGAAKVVLHGETLVDQTGKRVRLDDEVFAGRIAVVNFVYTTCTTICPIASATFAQLQDRLGAALGMEVVLVSISVDPLRDTPARLNEYAQRHQARAGWSWLTGTKPQIDRVLEGFGAYTPDFQQHPAMVLVGDAAGGNWTRLFGFPSVDDLLERIEALRVARAVAAHAGHQAGH
jgi:protein SCO1/2